MLSAPTLLLAEHDSSEFHCGIESLDLWLRQRAIKNQVLGASRTYVVTDQKRIVGYYCLSSGALDAIDAPGSIRRNMPDPIPIAILGRLAVDQTWQGRGLGVALLQDAVLRTGDAAKILGIRGLLVHALSTEAKRFYERYDFAASPKNPMTLVLSLKVERST